LDRNERLLFEEHGIVVHAETKLVTKMLLENWCQIDFITKDGLRITDVRKCGGVDGFENDYKNLSVIYLKGDPRKFQELFVFNRYSHLYALFFFFGLLGFGGTFVLYYFLKNITKIWET
jgi:hypothetical protein